VAYLQAQNTPAKPLPGPLYATMRDSSTSIDIVFLQGASRSISIDGKNVHLFNSFFENAPALKNNNAQVGMIMWQVHGKEFLSGNFFLGDSTGYVVINKDGKEYVNKINAQGNSFFKEQVKQ
jgi:hypothetical protein